ncbi:general secretion pathway protein GspK [bacterium]|nr:general secretion pathway protein GspK [bacterium]
MKRLKGEKKKKGVALIMALWIMVALLVICSSFVYMMRIEMRIAKDYTNGVKAHYLARAGLAHALGELKSDTNTTDSLHEEWFKHFSENFSYTAGYDEMVWDETGFLLGDGGYQVSLVDEAGMHNINAMEGGIIHPTSLVGLEDLLGEGSPTQADKDKACRIRDYQDADSNTMHSTSGGTGDDSAACKNYYYDTIREIQKVVGINIGSNPLADHTNELTVYSEDLDTTLGGMARVNLNTACQAEIQAALVGIDSDPAGVAASIVAGQPNWQTVGKCLYTQLSGSGNTLAKRMKKAADKFTVAPPAANAVYYKPAALPNLILGPININTAPKWALCSLYGISQAKATDIIKTRHGIIPPYGLRCDGAVQSSTFTYGVADTGNYGRGEVMLTTGIAGGTFDDMSDQITVRSDRFTIVSTGRVGVDGDGDGKIDPPYTEDTEDTVSAQRKIEVVVDRHFHDGSGQGFEILYWSETVPEY